MTVTTNLQNTIEDMVDDKRGILTADESSPTVAKRFSAISTEPSEESRRNYRSLLLSTSLPTSMARKTSKHRSRTSRFTEESSPK